MAHQPDNFILALKIIHAELRLKELTKFIASKVDGFDLVEFEFQFSEAVNRESENIRQEAMKLIRFDPNF